ncbi:MAG: NAD(P)/FAD-dependent oxidoreductase [Acidimicrobiales bacterium]
MTTQPTQSTHRYDHAVVLGGSMAGLVTAQALSRHFRRVTVVERDHLPAGPAARAGVPQGRHLHALLPGGADALETLLPGYADGLLGAGAVPLAVPTDMLWLNPAGWVTRFPVRHRMLSASRELIEWHTRRLVMATPEITVLDGHNVADLCVSEDGSRVIGVTVVETDAAGSASHGPVETLPAELVVDATGRRSRLPGWLERLGYERPAETRINAHLAYATRIYRRPDGDRGWKAIYIQSRPSESSRMGIMFPIEGDRWILTVQGAGDDRPPTDGAGFDEFTASLRSSAIHDALRDAEPLTAPVGFANTANLRRHYDKARRWPERLLAVGDSACTFNPVYGQGMSVAAQTAVALDAQLTKHARRHATLDGFVRPMQRRVAKTGNAAWMIATGDDLRMATTTGAKASTVTRMQHRYLDRVLAAATTDETVLAAAMQAFFLLAPPTVLFRPSILARALRSRPGAATVGEPPVATPPRQPALAR